MKLPLRNLRACCLLVITCVLFAAGSGQAWAVINGEAMADDKRLDAVCAVSHTNWLGIKVGAGEPAKQHNWFGTGILISPKHIVTARHLIPKGNNAKKVGFMAARFRRKPDGSLGSKTKPADSYVNVRIMRWFVPEQGDVAIGVLEHEVEHIEPMPILWDVPENQPFKGLIAGWGSTHRFIGNGSPRPGLRVGPNEFVRQGNAIGILNFPTERKVVGKNKDGKPIMRNVAVGDVAMPNMHDSGGALLAVSPQGELRLVGVISSYRVGTYLGQYQDDDKFPLKAWAAAK